MNPSAPMLSEGKSPRPGGPLRSRGLFRSALLGFVIGVVAAVAYLVLGGACLFGVPRWAAVVFHPGFVAGFKVNEWGLSVRLSEAVGVLTVGLSYAVVLVIMNYLIACIWRGRRVTK